MAEMCGVWSQNVELVLFSTLWWSALLAIILIDLVLAGDNSIVIALAARNLPAHLQKKPSCGHRRCHCRQVGHDGGNPLAVADSGSDAGRRSGYLAAQWPTCAVAVAGVLGAGSWASRQNRHARRLEDRNLIAR